MCLNKIDLDLCVCVLWREKNYGTINFFDTKYKQLIITIIVVEYVIQNKIPSLLLDKYKPVS